MKQLLLNKTLHPDDEWGFEPWIEMVKTGLLGIPYRLEHHLRPWEYALAVKAIQENNSPIESVLEVGGGGSLLAPVLATLEKNVTVVDPEPCEHMIYLQNGRLNPKMPVRFVRSTLEDVDRHGRVGYFGAVVCISVIEHIRDDIEFFHLLLDRVAEDGILVLTTDFHPSGKPQCVHHLRTYNERRMNLLIDVARDRQFHPVGEVDYTYCGDFVNGYTFASLVLS